MRIIDMSNKFLCDVSEQNSNASWDKVPTEVIGIATLQEFVENYRFITGSTQRWILRKMSEIRMKLDNIVKD
jgi:hypothetical protein